VLTTIGDGKAAVDSNSDGVIDYYTAYIISVSDYSPFGVELASRTWSIEEYRNGFQKQEKDKELWEGAMYYKYRVEDPRLGRFFSVDPLYAKYPYNSNYAFSENRVIDGVEIEGLEVKLAKHYNNGGLVLTATPDALYVQQNAAILGGHLLKPTPTKFQFPAQATIGRPEWEKQGEKIGREFVQLTGIPAIYSSVTGLDFETNKALENWERTFSTVEAAFAIFGLSSEIKLLKGGGEFAKGLVKQSSNSINLATKAGGRLGNVSTRAHIGEIAKTLESRGYTITGGGGRTAEEFLKPFGGGRKGGSFLDITAIHPNYPTLRINTVDVYKNGMPTLREFNNAERIRKQIAPGEHLLLIPKR
jgi:RHS repeat-associated protein